MEKEYCCEMFAIMYVMKQRLTRTLVSGGLF
jgi:hypothetical protein